MPSKKDDLIVDLLQEVREDQRSHSQILTDLQINVGINTKVLAEHQKVSAGNSKRISELEEPRIAFKVLKKYLIGVSSIAAAIFAISKYI